MKRFAIIGLLLSGVVATQAAITTRNVVRRFVRRTIRS